MVVLIPLTQLPDLEAQREAMKKLGFLIGKWEGDPARNDLRLGSNPETILKVTD